METTRTYRLATKSNWIDHPFYNNALVLGIDSGIDGIGVCLRKGPEILFAQTFLVADTTKTLEERRLKRSWRRARKGRKKRENLLKTWIVRHKILPEERVAAIWNDPSVFQDAFKHRLRASKERHPGKENSLGSAEALVSCLRHAIQHRGFDYHLTGGGGFPWGEDLEFAKILQWAKRGCCSKLAVDQWMLQIVESEFAHDERKMQEVSLAFAEAVRRFEQDEIVSILQEHFKEEKHTNRRPAARGYHFPRELIKAHVRKICENNQGFFGQTDYQKAVNELIGPSDNQIYEWQKEGCIIDFHRKTHEQVMKLWESKTNECPYLWRLVASEDYKEVVRCSPNAELAVRKFKMLQFLAERTFILSDGLKHNATKGVFDWCINFISEDTKSLLSNTARPKLDKKALKEFVVAEVVANRDREKVRKTKQSFQKKSDHNEAFLDQLYDLLAPKRSQLNQRASLSAAAAQILFDQATCSGGEFVAAEVVAGWENNYYLWRMEPRSGGRVHPHVQYLLGHPSQYSEKAVGTRSRSWTGKSNDVPLKGDRRHKGARQDGKPQEHGILRQLFAGQLKDAMGRPVDLSSKLDGKRVPDYVVIETIGEIPNGPLQKRAIELRQRENRKHKEELAKKYNLGDNPRRSDLLRVVLFEQQIADGQSDALCPVTGQNLGSNPLDPRLQVAHIFPNSKGGLFERLNLFITTGAVNAAMGNRIPKECAGQTLNGEHFLEWREMVLNATRKMKWGKAKRDLFLKKDDEVPEWENLTRISQLARQLKVETERWLGLDRAGSALERAREVFERIGTPTGSMTAACRYSWRDQLPAFMVEKKHRCYLRHHLYDAIVLSHIPPGIGMNATANGGIFQLSVDKKQNPVLAAQQGLLPALEAFEQANAGNCLVHKHRSKKSKQSRAEQTIYSKFAEPNGESSLTLKVRKPLLQPVQGKDQFAPNKKAEEWLKDSGIPADKLPSKLVQEWAESNGARPLRLLDGTPVGAVPVKTTSEQVTSLFAHRNQAGELIGYKTATEVYEACQIWVGPKRSKKDGTVVLDEKGKPVMEYRRVLVPSARNLVSYKKMYGKDWQPAEPIPTDFTKVGQLKKGDVVRIGLDAAGEIVASETQKAETILPYRVGSIKSNGQVEFFLAEFTKDRINESPWKRLENLILVKPSSPTVLGYIVRTNLR